MLVDSELCEKTIQQKVSILGIGLFTGQNTQLTLCPAPPGTGLIFKRVDLPQSPEIPALLHKVVSSARCTKLATQQASVQMVEHLLSAVFALGITNLIMEVIGPEIPSLDGSALGFVRAIEEAGILLQPTQKRFIKIQEPIYWSQGDVHLIALPAEEFRISYTLHYPGSHLIGSQFYSFSLHPERYAKEIAPCRTFCLYEEIAPFIEQGIIKGGGLDNALVIKDDKVLNLEGIRFPDEMVRHKILDLLGDFALLGSCLLAHVVALRAGHLSHIAFAKKIMAIYLREEEPLEVFSGSYVLENC